MGYDIQAAFSNATTQGEVSMEYLKKVAMLAVGWVFVVLGVLGLFLPILQGILFIMIGLAILSTRSELIKRLLKRIEERYPHHHQRVEATKEKVWRWFKKT